MNIYASNLSYECQENDLLELFQQFGEVESVKIITDRDSGRSRGFGFVEMPNDEEGSKAIEALNGRDLQGRALNVAMAKPKAANTRGGGGRGSRY